MTSHQDFNAQDLQSPKKEGKAMLGSSTDDILIEISPTGIMGFPESMSGGSGKPRIPRAADFPSLTALDMPEDETPEHMVQHRITTTCEYWEAMEQEFLAGNLQFFVPRCDNPFEAFMVHQGHVRGLVEQWNTLFAASKQEEGGIVVEEEPPMVPMPGDAVLKLAAFFDHLAEQRLLEESMEPFVAYKTLSDKIRKQVAELEVALAPPTTTPVQEYTPVTVYRHVSPQIQPLVDFWNNLGQLPEPPSLMAEPAATPKNPRVVVMANLMQKQLEHLDTPKKTDKQRRDIEMDASTHCLVVEMVSLLEGMNYNIKTGGGNPLDAGHVHHVKSVPLVC